MSDSKTATERLREMLDERGEDYTRNDFGITWRYYSDPHTATESMDGTLIVTGLTPEQAIAATLGSAERTCKIESSYYYDDYDLYEFEFSCGHSVNMYDKEPTSYCPICGCKVVGE